MVPEDRAQARRSQPLPAGGALSHQKQPIRIGFGTFCQQIHINHCPDVGIQGHATLLGALAGDGDPPPSNVDVGDVQPQHFARPQAAPQHQSRDRPVSPRPQTRDQGRRIRRRQRHRQRSRLPQSQRRAGLSTSPGVGEHPRPLPSDQPPRLATSRDGIDGVRIPEPSEGVQARDRRQAPIDRRGRVPVHSLASHRHHVRPHPARDRRLPADPEIVEQVIGYHRREVEVLIEQPPAKGQQVIPIRSNRRRRVVPIQQIEQILIHELEPGGLRPSQHPTVVISFDPKAESAVHGNRCSTCDSQHR